jgi:hypothetical protein
MQDLHIYISLALSYPGMQQHCKVVHKKSKNILSAT